MHKNKLISLLLGTCVCSHTLIAHPQAETTFSGATEGVFIDPSGGVSIQAWVPTTLGMEQLRILKIR